MTKNERFKLETFVATRHKKRYKVLKEYNDFKSLYDNEFDQLSERRKSLIENNREEQLKFFQEVLAIMRESEPTHRLKS